MKKASKKVAAKKATKAAGKPAMRASGKTPEKSTRVGSSPPSASKTAKSNTQSSRPLKKSASSVEFPAAVSNRLNHSKKNAQASQSDLNRARLAAASLPNEASSNNKPRRNNEARERPALPIAAEKPRGGAKKLSSESTNRSRSEPVHAPPVKTHLNDKQLAEFKELLLLKRAQLTGDVQGLATEARGRSSQGDSEHSNMPIHMADLGSDTWEQDFTLGLIVNAESVVREIDEALERIKDKTYGVCTVGDDRIGIARLRAKPWAKHCIEHARLIEEGRLS